MSLLMTSLLRFLAAFSRACDFEYHPMQELCCVSQAAFLAASPGNIEETALPGLHSSVCHLLSITRMVRSPLFDGTLVLTDRIDVLNSVLHDPPLVKVMCVAHLSHLIDATVLQRLLLTGCFAKVLLKAYSRYVLGLHASVLDSLRKPEGAPIPDPCFKASPLSHSLNPICTLSRMHYGNRSL
ncbi:hypothetical protein K474DRAFT_15407 [Panus rudis PR-1116 ss-1]|nr:hypothetical protein K474DRAFT_15407 [Panus rudis PR-1116 ss-1]